MNDFNLFLKYNLIPTNTLEKNDKLINDLYYKRLSFDVKKNRENSKILLLMHGNYTCNLNCIYCEHNKLRANYSSEIMSEEIATLAIQKLGPILREVTWHGGEPTLLPNSLIETVEKIKTKNNYNFKTTFQTNGVLLTSEKIDFLNKLNIQWGTSFDGLDNNHNRGELSTKGILKLLKRKDMTGFINVYTKETADHMIENYEYYKTLGVKSFQSCVVRENVIENTNPYLLTSEDSAKYVLKYLDYWIHDTNNPITDNYLTRHIKRLLGVTSVCEDGYCLKGWFIIDPEGNIGQCGSSAKDNTIVNIRDISDYTDLLFHPKLLNTLEKQKQLINNFCKNCPWNKVCNGGCMGNNYEFDPQYEKLNPRMCKYNKLLLYGIYELIKDIDINDTKQYNPIFLQLLKTNNYFSLTEIKEIEQKRGNIYA